jgi:3-oxoacyl-(acyl-carrier-protein) synthase/NADP-dependent 3-hydroxy acid dehydrogenase YdfG
MSKFKSSSENYPIGVFVSVFTGNELFLEDHIIQGKKILPGMAYLELSRAAVANSVKISDEQMIVLEDSVFIQAILVTQKREIEVKVFPGAPGEFGVEVSSTQGIHFQTKALVKEKQDVFEAEKIPHHLDLDILQEECSKPGPSKSQFYENMRKREVILGPSHQGIETIHIGDKTALVSLSLPGSANRNMAMDPGMLDSIIQSGIALSNNPEADVVPFAVKKTLVFDDLVDKMFAYVVKKEDAMDYFMLDETGEVKVVIKGFLAREIEINAQEDQLVYYKPVWLEESVNEADTPEDGMVTVITEERSFSNLVKSVFGEVKRLVENKTEDHLIEVRLPKHKPENKGIIALLKTAVIEYPKIKYRVLVENKILKTGYKELELPLSNKNWPDNKVILITGGLGGVGKLICFDIAENSKGNKLILAGRSELSGERRKIVKELESKGVEIQYVKCDVSDENQVNDLIVNYPEINGVIHCSGSNADNLITRKTVAEIDKVLAPKVQGLQYLDKATARLNLDYFIAFSSIAGTLGNAGQSDYSAANAYMDAYIKKRSELVNQNKRFGKSISINWPLWESDGMQLDEETKKNLLEVFKIKPLPAKSGLKALKEIINSDHDQVVVLFGNKKNIKVLFEKPKETKKPVQPKEQKAETNKLDRKILENVKDQVAKHLKRQADELDETADWAEFGFDSILLSSFINKFNAHFNLNMMPTVMFEATNIQQFSEYLKNNFATHFSKDPSRENNNSAEAIKQDNNNKEVPEEVDQEISPFARSFKRKYKSNDAYRDADLAVVGMSCRIAGARNPDEFWKMLIEEKDMISEIPEDRWNWRDYPGISKWGSFIEDIQEFDSLFFGISPAEAIYMSPEQRLMLQYVWECMEDAGYSSEELKGTNTGFFMGCGPSSYVHLLSEMPVEAYSATGMVPSVGPNRVSFLMDWHGPSNPIDTACSSSLVALHRAMEAIRLGHCDQAFIGGVNALLAPDVYISFSKSGMLCEDGRCKTFSDKANGYVRGEGIGILMVKKLDQAIKDGNHIYAVVKGTAENHGGHANSLTAPNPRSQAAVIKRAVEDAGIDFSRVSYVECHGTGTPLGDPIEIEGLKTVASELSKSSGQNHKCMLGSIKSNIGHLEYGAGIVGLIKVILQMKHKKIAKSLHCDALNPYIQLEGTPFEVARESSDWSVPDGKSRVAGVSSFGFGGVNSHIILEEYPHNGTFNKTEPKDYGAKMILVLSAQDEEGLIRYLTKYQNFIKSLDHDLHTLERIAYTLQVGRSEMQERIAFVAESFEEWSEQIDTFLSEKGVPNGKKVFRGSVKRNSSRNQQNKLNGAGADDIKKLHEENNHEKIAELWVNGSKINWNLLYSKYELVEQTLYQ